MQTSINRDQEIPTGMRIMGAHVEGRIAKTTRKTRIASSCRRRRFAVGHRNKDAHTIDHKSLAQSHYVSDHIIQTHTCTTGPEPEPELIHTRAHLRAVLAYRYAGTVCVCVCV